MGKILLFPILILLVFSIVPNIYASYGGSPLIAVSPSFGNTFPDIVTVYGWSFGSGASVSISTNPNVGTASATADTNGYFTAQLQIAPPPSGTQSIAVAATAGGNTATTSFIDTSPPSGGPTIQASSISGSVGTQVTVTGSNFNPNGLVYINILPCDPSSNSSSGPCASDLATSTTDGTGAFSKQITIPNQGNSPYLITVFDNTYKFSVNLPFTRTTTADTTTTSVSLNPSTVNTGSQTTITTTVTDTSTSTNPVGTVSFNDGNPSAGGIFGSFTCNPSGNDQLVCTTSYTAPGTASSVTIDANYSPSNSQFAASSGSAILTVTTPPQPLTPILANATGENETAIGKQISDFLHRAGQIFQQQRNETIAAIKACHASLANTTATNSSQIMDNCKTNLSAINDKYTDVRTEYHGLFTNFTNNMDVFLKEAHGLPVDPNEKKQALDKIIDIQNNMKMKGKQDVLSGISNIMKGHAMISSGHPMMGQEAIQKGRYQMGEANMTSNNMGQEAIQKGKYQMGEANMASHNHIKSQSSHFGREMKSK